VKVLTLADLLAPYRANAVAEAVGVTADTVRLWQSQKTRPSADKISALAAFLRVDAQVIVDAIAAQRQAVA
jgi:transcriptional regulator with XRE-family HTH domain